MFIKNAQDKKYANGTLGTVISFEKATDHPVVELINGRKITVRPDTWELMDGEKRRAQLMQLPLRLAWAITVHKSQGMTLDAARIDLSRAFVEGMGYVALSRVRSLKHLILDGMNGMALRVSPLAKEIDNNLRSRSEQALVDNAELIRTWQAEEANGEHERQMEEASAEAPADPELYEKLRAWRFAQAQAKGVPPYVIAHDKTLMQVSALKPQNEKELLNVPGFGPVKVETYGADILKIVKEAPAK